MAIASTVGCMRIRNDAAYIQALTAYPELLNSSDADQRHYDQAAALERDIREYEAVRYPSAKATGAPAFVMWRNATGQVLSVARHDDPTKIGLPGGKAEPGEVWVQTALREFREETGVSLRTARELKAELVTAQGITAWAVLIGEAYASRADDTAVLFSGAWRGPEGTTVEWVAPDALTGDRAAYGLWNAAAFEALR